MPVDKTLSLSLYGLRAMILATFYWFYDDSARYNLTGAVPVNDLYFDYFETPYIAVTLLNLLG